MGQLNSYFREAFERRNKQWNPANDPELREEIRDLVIWSQEVTRRCTRRGIAEATWIDVFKGFGRFFFYLGPLQILLVILTRGSRRSDNLRALKLSCSLASSHLKVLYRLYTIKILGRISTPKGGKQGHDKTQKTKTDRG